MLRNRLNIGVVGAGIGGLAAARLLKDRGHVVKVFDRFSEPKPVGSGLLLQPTGAAVLTAMGLGVVEENGARIEKLEGFGRFFGWERKVLDLEYKRLNPLFHGTGVHRASLFSSLLEAVKDAGVTRVDVKSGFEVVDVKKSIGGGAEIVSETGETEEFDLVVLANGMRSKIRDQVFGGGAFAPPFQYGALWTVVKDETGEWHNQKSLQQRYNGPQKMAGVMPIGSSSSKYKEQQLLTIFWSMKESELKEWKNGRGDLEAWREEWCRLWPEDKARRVAESVENFEVAEYDDVHLEPVPFVGVFAETEKEKALEEQLKRLERYRDPFLRLLHPGHSSQKELEEDKRGQPPIVVLGDAAHGTSPQLGQGANLALVDALVLADSLDNGASLYEGLARYWITRHPIVWPVQFYSRYLTLFFQSDYRVLGYLRDLGLGPFCRAPVTREFVLRVLSGCSKGLFSSFSPSSLAEIEAQRVETFDVNRANEIRALASKYSLI